MRGRNAASPADIHATEDIMSSQAVMTQPTRRIDSVAEIVQDCIRSFGQRPAIRYDAGCGYPAIGFDEYAANVARALQVITETASAQVICTFVQNRPEWDMVALACLYTGNILFPLDTKMDDDELEHLLAISPPDVVLVSRASRSRMQALLRRLELAPRLLLADLYPTLEDAGAPPVECVQPDELRLSDVPPAADGMLQPPAARLHDADTVLGHYATSGTTSLPKVVRITHGGIVAQVNEGLFVLNLRPAEDVLNLGPYTHIATLLEFLVTKVRGFCVTYFTREADEGDNLEREIRRLRAAGIRIRAMMAVPRFWIFIMKEVLEEMKGKAVWSNLYRHLTGIETATGNLDLGTLDKAKLVAVRAFLRNKLGGHLTWGISSSTRIDPGVIAIFAQLGITILDIYGATEASGIIARNRLHESRPGSCGRLIDQLEYRIAESRHLPGYDRPVGELLLRGPSVALGYVGQPNRSHLDAEGFYHTGDLAWVDDERWVFLAGREKEQVRWEDGSLIDRMHLSNLLTRSIWVRDALVTRLGDDDFLSVFILPDSARIEKDRGWRATIAAGVDPAAALRERLVEAIVFAAAQARITPRLSTDRIYLLERPLERTPTHKIRFIRELERLDLDRYLSST
jgi:long-chain acyl-CoA synthetase